MKKNILYVTALLVTSFIISHLAEEKWMKDPMKAPVKSVNKKEEKKPIAVSFQVLKVSIAK